MESSATLPVNKHKSRRSLILLCLAFIVPIVIAKIALEQQWFNYGVTNKGQLLEQPIHLKDLNLAFLQDNDKQQQPWLMLVNLPSPCDANCQSLFGNMNNTYIALGKEIKRVTPVALMAKSEQDSSIKVNNRWVFTDQTIPQNNRFNLGEVIIVDPLGNVVMSHQLPDNNQAFPAVGKAIVADFKKLLKYSRIG